MSSIGPYKVHPAADMFPMMAEDELAELAADIRERGQVEPIVISGATLLDGRNRMRACKLAGVVPVTWEWDGTGGTPVGFIVAKNVKRRHLDPSQRGMLGADLLLTADHPLHSSLPLLISVLFPHFPHHLSQNVKP